MQNPLHTILAAAASALCLALATPATAADRQAHVWTMQLPDGAVEQIAYRGDVPPQILLGPAPVVAPFPVAVPVMDPYFAAMARMSAIMQQQEAAMLQLAASAPALQEAAFGDVPAGGVTTIVTVNSNGACTRRTEITYSGDAAAPRTVSDTEGDCATPPAARVPTRLSHPARRHDAAPSARIIEARATGTNTLPGLLHEAVWRP
jgi:hypothetical protein